MVNNTEYSIGRWISILYRYGQSYLSKRLEDYNIGSGQYVILMTLFRNGGISQEKLSDHLKIDKGSIAKSIKKLMDDGYIERNIDLDDKRAYKIYLTQKAADIMPVLQGAISNWEDSITSNLTNSEKDMVEELLHEMAKNAYYLKTNEENKNEKNRI